MSRRRYGPVSALSAHTLGNERDQAHLPAAYWAQQRKDLVDACDQYRPQVVDLYPALCICGATRGQTTYSSIDSFLHTFHGG